MHSSNNNVNSWSKRDRYSNSGDCNSSSNGRPMMQPADATQTSNLFLSRAKVSCVGMRMPEFTSTDPEL